MLAADAAWAAAGHEIAWGQAVCPAAVPTGVRAEDMVEGGDHELCLGTAVLSRATGMPTAIGGLPVETFGLVRWWPPTDNDLGREWGSEDCRPLAAQWKDAGLERMHTRVLGITAEPALDGGEQRHVSARMDAADKAVRSIGRSVWTSGAGSLALRTQVLPVGDWVNAGFEVEWARIGVELVLAAETAVSSFGKGPHQSYPDTGQGARTGWFELPFGELDADYVRPRESGARCGVRSAVLETGGRHLSLAGEPFVLTVRMRARCAGALPA